MTKPSDLDEEDEDEDVYDVEITYEMEIANEKLRDAQDALDDISEQFQQLREIVVDVLIDLVRNGEVDDLTGYIDSRCDPAVLRQLASYVGVEI